MDAKDLRIETALGERNDGSKYSQSGVAIQSIRNKSYQDIGSNPLAKAEATVRPCAVIGPDRVVPPPSSNEAYLKKASLDIWTRPENIYPRPPEYPLKPFNNVNPLRNISPRQTFQENMPRIMVSPTYSSIKHANDANLGSVQDPNVIHPKNTKQTTAPEAKYCDVPYTVNYLPNEHKNVRESEMFVPSVNSLLTRTAPQAWPPSGVNLHASRMYGAHDVYQYPQYPNGTVPRPPAVPMTRPHRTFPEEAGYVCPDSYYQDASVRFKPYPSVKERYPQARYDYISNYPSPFHPPPTYLPHKYDISNTRPHPYPMYPHLKYLENRVPEPNIEGYQRPNQSYNMPIRNHFMHPSYQPGIGNTQSKAAYPDATIKTSGKPPFDPNKAYVDYENAKLKYTLPDFFVNDMSRSHQVQKQGTFPNYGPAGMHPIQMQQYQRKDNTKTYEYVPHYRHFEHPIGFNPSNHQTSQFSPSTIAISPTDSNTSNDHHMPVTSQEDCGYVSQSSSASVRSFDSGNNRLQNEYYRRHDLRYQHIIGNPHNLPKHDTNPTNIKDNTKIDVRQFLSMWNEGDEDNSTNGNSKSATVPTLSDPNNLLKRQENAKSQDQLYVLGLVNVPSEELAKYEHIQKVSKLPENIKGYNNIELLNQFEEVIEFSNMNNFKSSSAKEFMSTKDRKNAIKRIVEVLPRPISPLDVEAKISQSVIHKEVGCNFEIKPCSPKMLNVEIASPVQNILGERVIEKVTNPLSYKAKSPLSMRIEGNTSSNKIQRHESTLTTYENSSCKMVGSPFSTNNMEPVKTSNYSLQDLETNSGVCLASLPRLDNEIELNFPEVNQQFINANKGGCNLLEKYYSKKTEDNVNTASSNKRTENNLQIWSNESADHLTNHIENKTAAINNFENQSNETNANASRKDSVIIENPENVKKYEEKHLYKTGNEVDIPMNLTQNNSHAVDKADTTNSFMLKSHQTESALDFSQNKSETDLPIINAYDDITPDMLTESNFDSHFEKDYAVKHNDLDSLEQSPVFVSNKINMKSIIVKNNSNTDCELENEDAKQHDVFIHEKPAENFAEDVETNEIEYSREVSDGEMETDFHENKVTPTSQSKETLTKVIVEQKSYRESSNHETIEHEEKPKSTKNEEQIKHSEGSRLDNKEIGQKPTTRTEILERNITVDNPTISTGNEIEVCQTNSSSNIISHECNNTMLSEKNTQNQCMNAQSDTDISTDDENLEHKETVVIDDSAKNTDGISTETGLNKDAGCEINTESTHNSSKYYSDLISVTELLLDKASDDSDVLRTVSPNNNNGNAFDDDDDDAISSPQTNTSDDTFKNPDDMESIKIHEQDHFTLLHDNNTGSNVDESNRTISDDITTKLVAHRAENNELVINSLADKTEVLANSIEFDNYGMNVSENKLLFDKYGSTDSGYESHKKYFVENDRSSITDISGNNINQDPVSKDEDTLSNHKFVNEIVEKDDCDENIHQAGSENENISKDLQGIPSCGQISSANSSTASTIISEDKVSDAKNYEQQTNDIYDKVDANMQILFQQPNNGTNSEAVDMKYGEIGNNDNCIQTKSENNHTDNSDLFKTLPREEIVHAEGDEQPRRNCELDIIKENKNIKGNETEHKPDLTMIVDEDDMNTQNDNKTVTNETHQIIPFDNVNTTNDCTNEVFTKLILSDNQQKELHNSLFTKRKNTRWNIKKYCPFYQKLLLIDIKVGKVTFQQEQNIKCVVEVPTDIDNLHVGDSEIKSNNADLECKYSHEKLCDESSNSLDTPFPSDTNDIIAEDSCSINKKYDSKFESDCIAECADQNDLIDTQDISFSYTDNSIISEITESILIRNESILQLNCDDNDVKKNEIKCSDHNINYFSPLKRHRPLKRALSDSALNIHVQHNTHEAENSRLTWPSKRNKMSGFENLISSNRRNSVNFEENVSFCILIDEDCIITEENEDKICIAELQGNFITTEVATESNNDTTSAIQDLYTDADETNNEFINSETLECEKENLSQGSWIDDIGCVETVFSDEVAENVVISAPTSPTDTAQENYHDNPIYYDIPSTCYTDKVKLLHGEKLSYEDAQVVDALYKTPHMDIMNKTLLYGDKNISDSDNLSDDDSGNINLESDEWKASPTHIIPDYIDPTHVSSEFRLETPENKENVFVKELSPLRKIDDYLDVSCDEHILSKPVDYFTERTQDSTIHSCESSLDNVFDYKLKDNSISTKTSALCSTSSSPEVSSTTSEEKNSSLVLKITNLNGARISQINEVEKINKPRCKFTENNEYSASNVHFPNRPLMTKAAQKYIPPIKEPIRDLKVRITLPQQSLLKLKQLKMSQSDSKPKVRQHAVIPRISKKPKLNFDDVLKSIDEMQFKKHKEKSKKPKTVVPKVVIKKTENGSHYASTTPNKNSFNPDLTGRKWQPWVFLEKSQFIDKMATRNKTKAIFSHRKNAYILAEKFKKYKSVSSTKFIISQPKTPGDLKYTIRLKHTY